ncbi:hypothetical protein BST61_g11124 [Cercospora zeina]
MSGLSCAGPLPGGTGANYNEAKSLISNFCSSAANSIVSPSTNQTGLYKTSQGNSDLQLTISYSTTRLTYDTACSLDPDAAHLPVSQSSCEHAFFRLLDQCDTSASSSLGKYGGTALSGCGVYTLTTSPEELIACGGNPADLFLAPDPLSPSGEAATATFWVDVPEGKSYYNFVKHGVVVKIVTQFNNEVGREGCVEPKGFGTKGDECRRKLGAVRERCGKEGGGLSENARNGCVLWTVWGQGATG